MNAERENHGWGRKIKPKQHNRQPPAPEAVRVRDSMSEAQKLEEIKRAFRRVQS
ncbi:hypothetical protein [Paraburkholderia sp. C35]|uniref:hypothetical protein n=1 Tax=Paraburkholderia sp. C35 TaxID=2126993 RepID=UPI0013A5825E|nr:hypothetical protein [Paraburkholderia sp. C35]